MTTAIDVVTNALQGDAGARSFLEQTCSIYVLDKSRTAPTILGCWTFLQEGLNELDRYESSPYRDSDGSLLAPAKLVAEMGLRVARRSNAVDDALVRTCLENGQMADLSTTIVQTNGELRERVIARMAALAFDGNENDDDNSLTQPIIREAFAAAIAANAVSNAQIDEFVGWIMSNSRSLPSFSVACVLLHVSLESTTHSRSRRDADLNIEALQKLSTRVMSDLLGPIWRDSIQNIRKDEMQRGVDDDMSVVEDRIRQNSRTASKVLEAIAAWCRVTGLSLPGLRHILKKAGNNLTDLIVSTMGINEPRILGALADWLEYALTVSFDDEDDEDDEDDLVSMSSSDVSYDALEHRGHGGVPKRSTAPVAPEKRHPFAISQLCMTQMRYVMRVDETSFRTLSKEQLETVESNELKNIILDLVHSTAVQRFRLADLANGRRDDSSIGICLSLTRIAVVLCLSYRSVCQSGVASDPSTYSTFQKSIPSAAFLDLFLKCASSPIISLAALALPLTAPVLASEAGLATQWLPPLQRLAIIPHHDAITRSEIDSQPKVNGMTESGDDSIPSLIAVDSCGDSFDQFILFRDTVLTRSLRAAFRGNKGFFLASCTSAVEEFCSDQQALTDQTPFHLEAALFCLSTVASDAMQTRSNDTADGLSGSFSDTITDDCLERCALALSKKPAALTSNPLTLLQACRFFDRYHMWFAADKPPGVFDIAVDLILTVILLCSTHYPEAPLSIHIYDECGIGPYSRAAQVLSKMLQNDPRRFLTNKSIASLGAAWEASFSACNQSKKWLSLEDRKNIARGICGVLALLQPISQQQTSIVAVAIPSLCCIDAMLVHAENSSTEKGIDIIMDRLSDEISLITTIVTAFPEPATFVCQRAWPTLNRIALKYRNHKTILSSLTTFMSGCLRRELADDDHTLMIVQELCALSTSLLTKPTEHVPKLLPQTTEHNRLVVKSVVEILSAVLDIYGDHLSKRTPLSDEFEKATKVLLEAGISKKSGMGRRTESGQLAFEWHESVSGENPRTSKICGEENSGTNHEEDIIDGAVTTFASLLRVKCPSLYAKAMPSGFQ